MIGRTLGKIVRKSVYGATGIFYFLGSFNSAEARHTVRFRREIHQKVERLQDKEQDLLKASDKETSVKTQNSEESPFNSRARNRFRRKSDTERNILKNMLVRTKRNRDFAYLSVFLRKNHVSGDGEAKKLNYAALGKTPCEQHYLLDAGAKKVNEDVKIENNTKSNTERQKLEKREDLAGTYLIVLLGTSLKELMGHATLTVSYLRYGKFKPIVQNFPLIEKQIQDDRQIFIRLDPSKKLRKKVIAWKVVLEDKRSGKTYVLESFVWKRLIRKAF